jgi:putative restriction endonuclease
MREQTLTYKEAADQTGASPQGMGSCLGPIQRYCEANDLPLLSAIVVSSSTGLPGDGFGGNDQIEAQQRQVFTHDWLRTQTPTPEALARYIG